MKKYRNQYPMSPRVRRKFEKTIEMAADFFQVDKETLWSKQKQQDIVFARWFVFKVARVSGWSLHNIGKVFKKDHGTVLHGINQLDLMISVYPDWREDWNDFYKKCEAEFFNTETSSPVVIG